MNRPFLPFLILVTLLQSGIAFGVDSYAVEPAPPASFKAISNELARGLDPHGVQVVGYLGGRKVPVCNVWWRAKVKLRRQRGDRDRVYPAFQNDELLGVIQYLVPTEDFQHHGIKPGFYSLRYADLDQDDSDEVTSPYPDFAILSPIWADHDANDVVPMQELLKRSRFVTHEDDPAVLSLVPSNPAYRKLPWVISDDKGFCTLQVVVSAESMARTIPLAVIVIRPPHENEGS